MGSSLHPSVLSVNIGLPDVLGSPEGEVLSGIRKAPVTNAVRLTKLNLAGDAQADLVNHGGPDKALCVYCIEHYPHWERELGRKLPIGAFGENLTVVGLTEDQVCIGDVFQLDEAVVQITQPRGPCFKLARLHDDPLLAQKVQDSGFTGYYFRVLQEGLVRAKPDIRLLERDPAGLTVAFTNEIKYRDKHNAEALRSLVSVPALSSSWRESFQRRLSDSETAT